MYIPIFLYIFIFLYFIFSYISLYFFIFPIFSCIFLCSYISYCSEYSGILSKIGLVTCKMKVHPWNVSFSTYKKLWILLDLGSLYVIKLLHIFNFFFENFRPRLTSGSKLRGSVSHDDLKFWFSGNAYRGEHCLLLPFHLSYYIRCIMRFKKIADTSWNNARKR